MLPVPYWRLSGYYFFYFAFVGVFSPYFGLYLQSLTFSAWEISILMTQMQMMRLVGPYFWSALVDRFDLRMAVIRASGVATLLLFCTLFFVRSFEALLLCIGLFSFFWVAALPLVETATFDHLRNDPGRYSRIRLWGSVGFIVTVLGAGALLDRSSSGSQLWLCAACLAGLMGCGLSLPDSPQSHPHESHPSIGSIVRQPQVVALLAACIFMSAAHGALYVFYAIFLSEHGYSKSMVGALWTLGVLVEIGLFFYMGQIMRRFALRAILLASLGAAAIRFVMIGLAVDSVTLLALAQLLHGLTFAAFHSAAIASISRWFPGNTRARGQALYSSLSFGAGGAVGGLVSGWAWEIFGGKVAFASGSLFAVFGLLVLYRWGFDPPAQRSEVTVS